MIIGLGLSIPEVASRGGGTAGSPPANSVAPVISGNTQVTQTLTTTDGTWTGDAVIAFTYQWKRAGVDIASATNNTYVLAVADAGQAITCVVTGTNGVGNSTGTSNTLTTDVYLIYITNIVDGTDVAAAGSYSGGVWNGVSIGTAAANRKIVLVNCCRDSSSTSTISSQTIGGNTTTDSITVSSASDRTSIRILDLTTGTTANFVTTIGGTGSMLRLGVGVWALYGAGSSTPSDTDSSTTDAGSVTLTVPAKGVAVGGSVSAAGVSCTWTGLTERYDGAIETTIIHTGADLNSNAGGDISMNADWFAVPTNPLAAFASWGP